MNMQQQKQAIPYKYVFGVCIGVLLLFGGMLTLVAVRANSATRALGGHDLTPLLPVGVLEILAGLVLCSVVAVSMGRK